MNKFTYHNKYQISVVYYGDINRPRNAQASYSLMWLDVCLAVRIVAVPLPRRCC